LGEQDGSTYLFQHPELAEVQKTEWPRKAERLHGIGRNRGLRHLHEAHRSSAHINQKGNNG